MNKIVFTMGELVDDTYPFEITVAIRKTWYNRIRFWLFFQFFPFKFKEWLNT